MPRPYCSRFAQAGLALSLVAGLGAYQDEPVVFKSEVSLVRVDVQVISSTNQIVSGLRREDFLLRENGREREIVNFGRENLPLDLVLLLDVSGSMRPNVERIAEASHSALRVLGNEDRVALMVFDRRTRVSMPFRDNHDEIVKGFQRLLDKERFNGGTDITRAMYDAVRFLEREARPGARRAIVILTDDQTEFDRDDEGVLTALERANTVMSALLAPDAIGASRRRIPTTSRRGGGGMGGWGGLGGIILGGGGIPGSRRPPIQVGGRLQSAGTAEISRASGGDSMSVDDASALEDTLARIRQSYALYFNAPEGVKQGESRRVQVELTGSAARRYANAELRYRSHYVVTEGGAASGPAYDTEAPPTVSRRAPAPADEEPEAPVVKAKRRPAVNEPSRRAPPSLEPKTEDGEPEAPRKGGFRRLKPGEQPD